MVSVHIVPVLRDNYAYLLVDDAKKEAAAVDPAEPRKLLDAARSLGVRITCVLTTHEHADHAGGNEEMAHLIPEKIPIYGGEFDRCLGATEKVSDGQILNLFGEESGIKVRVVHTPYHTRGHVLYVVEEGEEVKHCFTGDALFVCGCGRINAGGSATELSQAMRAISSLPDSCNLWVGHEYTEANLRFALTVDPDNSDLDRLAARVRTLRAENKPTVPSTVAQEKSTNPFMRPTSQAIRKFTEADDSTPNDEVTGRLRAAKDRFGLGSSAGTAKK